MKKQLLTLALFAVSAIASAQSSFTITDSNSDDVTGQTVNYWIPASASDSRIFTVTNISESNLVIKVRKTILQYNDPGATAWFCTDQNCYAPTAVLSGPVTMAMNGGHFDLSVDFNPNNVPGVAQVRYSIIDQANPADSATLVIVYNISSGPAGIATVSQEKASISNPAPNPASSVFAMDYKLGSAYNGNAKLIVYNMLGDKVSEEIISAPEGVVKMDVSALDNGVYFCSLEADGKALATHRLVVSH